MGDNALIGTGMALLFGGVLGYAVKTRAMPFAPSHIQRQTAPKSYWMAMLLCAVLLALGVKLALTPHRQDERARGVALHRPVASVAAEQRGKYVTGEKGQRELEAAASMRLGDVDSRYAELAGIWSEDASCGENSGSQLHISTEGLDFGHSHFHVESVELEGNNLGLHGHYVTHQGITEDKLNITVIKRTPLQLNIFGKSYFRCS